MPPKNRRNKAAMETTDSAIAGTRRSFLRVCMTPVKSMRNRIMPIGFLAAVEDRLIAALDAIAITKIKPTVEQTHKAILRALMFSGVKEVMGSA